MIVNQRFLTRDPDFCYFDYDSFVAYFFTDAAYQLLNQLGRLGSFDPASIVNDLDDPDAQETMQRFIDACVKINLLIQDESTVEH